MHVVERTVVCDNGSMVLKSLGPHAHDHFASEANVRLPVGKPDTFCDLTGDVQVVGEPAAM